MGESPVVEVDFGIARVYVEGSEDNTLEEVESVADQKLQDVEPMVEELKRMDHELREEYLIEEDGESLGRSFS